MITLKKIFYIIILNTLEKILYFLNKKYKNICFIYPIIFMFFYFNILIKCCYRIDLEDKRLIISSYIYTFTF